MHILVVGAAGRTGRLVVEQALGHGHRVRAFVHERGLDVADSDLEIVRGDVLDFEDVSNAVEGVDAVAFTVGSGGGRNVTVFSEGIGNVLHAMAVHDVSMLAAVSAAGVFARKDPTLSIGFRTMIATALKPVYDDLERMEQRIAASGVGWTIVRPGGLSDDPAVGRYRQSLDGSLLPKMKRISRADVAAVVLKAIETGVFEGRTIVVSQ